MAARGRHDADSALLAALLGGLALADAAQQAHVSERTARRRMADPAFVAELDRLRGEVLQGTADRLTGAGAAAVQRLVNLMNGAASEAVRLAACRAILSEARDYYEHAALSARLDRLEGALQRTLEEGNA